MTNQQTSFAIGIPTINRADLLQETLEKLQNDFPNTAIYIIDNGAQEFDLSKINSNVFFTINDTNAGVAGSWNKLCQSIYNGLSGGFTKPCTHALILNDDIYFGKNESQVLKFIVENQFSLATTTNTWCVFLLSEIAYRKVGKFDENFFPAYYEDNDYGYRLLLAGMPYIKNEFFDPQIFRNSETIKKDPELNNRFDDNKQLFIRKWGGEPGEETYLSAYNKPEFFSQEQ